MTESGTLTIPEVRQRLYHLADVLDSGELRFLASQLHRRRAGHNGKPASRRMTPELAQAIRTFAQKNPDVTEHAIGVLFGVNQGRVSEALVGFRDGTTRGDAKP